MAKAQERTPQNTFRFMPGRKEAAQDGKMLFNGIRYSRKAVEDAEKGFLAGVAIGPGQHMPKEEEGPGFKLSAGGVIVPAYPNEKLETVPVRDFEFKDENKVKRSKQYIDFATFQKHGMDLFRVVPFMEDKVMYGEVWTGDIDEGEGTYQLIQADMFGHGSVPFVGKDSLVIDASSTSKSKKKKKDGEVSQEQEHVRASSAELLGERSGRIVAGIPLWVARLWRIHYSAKDSEAILVRQLGRFYLVLVENEKPVYHQVPESKYKRHFERLMGDELAAAAPKASVAA